MSGHVTQQTAANVRQAVPFFMVRDIGASARFYVDGLGFTMANQWIDAGKLRWCWLELGGAALMLQEFRTEGRHKSVPTEPVGVGVSIYFICRDAIAIYHDLRGRGVDARRPFVGNRMWVTRWSTPTGTSSTSKTPPTPRKRRSIRMRRSP